MTKSPIIPANSPAMFSLFIIPQSGAGDGLYKLTVYPSLQSRHSKPRRSGAGEFFLVGAARVPAFAERIHGPDQDARPSQR